MLTHSEVQNQNLGFLIKAIIVGDSSKILCTSFNGNEVFSRIEKASEMEIIVIGF